jgi:hypothetical protein
MGEASQLGCVQVMVVHAYNLYAGIENGVSSKDARGFYKSLAEDLIDNNYDRMTLRIHRKNIRLLRRHLTNRGAYWSQPSKDPYPL